MKSTGFKLMTIITTLVLWGEPQSAASQKSNNNKVKKVEYLGYKYKGQVNGDKVPEGQGEITIGNLFISGYFEGTTVSDAKVTNVDGTRFEGNITFNANNQIELKAGGVYVVNYRNIYHTIDRFEARDTLNQNRIVNFSNFEPDSVSMTREISLTEMEIRPSLNPPAKFYFKVPLRKGEYYISGSPEKHFGFVDDTNYGNKYEDLFKFNNFKDSQGRVWSYSRRDKGTRSLAYSYTVTYPDNSFYSNVEGHDSWKIYYPDGKSLTSKGRLTIPIPEGVLSLYYPREFDSVDDFVKLNNSKTIPNTKSKVRISEMVYKNNDISTMSNDAIISFIKEKLMPHIYSYDNNTSITIRNKDRQEVGVYYYENGNYISEIERKKQADAIDAAEEKARKEKEAAEEKARKAKEAAEEKARQAKLASYTKRFGFNPSGKSIKQLVAVGRSYSLVRDYVNDYYVGGQNYWFSFAEDTGISKGYRVIRNNSRVGYIYVQNNRIINVRWY